MSILLIRHALAGDPEAWQGDDRVRPLDESGQRQAEALVDALADFPLDRIISSSYVRCVQTVEPLAEVRGLKIELDGQLEAERLEEVPEVLERLRGESVAVCTHGDLPWLGDRNFEKGSTWVLNDELRPERYIAPRA